MVRNYRRVPSSEGSGSSQAAAGAGVLVPPPPLSGNSDSAASVSASSDNASVMTTSNHNNNNNDGTNNNNSSSRGHGSNRSLSERFQDKLFAAAWVTVALLLCWWSKTPHVLLQPSAANANKSLLQVVALLLGINTILLAYLTVYLPRFKGLTDSSAWEVYCPAVIPSMTGLGVLSFCLAIRATWPVWGFLAPFVLSIQCLGLLFSLHFVPF